MCFLVALDFIGPFQISLCCGFDLIMLVANIYNDSNEKKTLKNVDIFNEDAYLIRQFYCIFVKLFLQEF